MGDGMCQQVEAKENERKGRDKRKWKAEERQEKCILMGVPRVKRQACYNISYVLLYYY